MELNQLRYFYEVAKQGSFTKASLKLRVSQPSISKMVKQLEYQEGYFFLERGKKGVRLTPMGQILYEGCEKIFEEFANIQITLNKRKEECSGELWIGASDNLCNYIFPSLLTSFQQLYPKVQIKLFSGTSESILKQLKEYLVEVGVFYTPNNERSLLSEVIGFVEFVIVVSGNKFQTAPSLRELNSLGYVGSRQVDYIDPYPAMKMLHSLGVKPILAIETNNQESQKRLVLEGMGYTVLPKHMVVNETTKRKLLFVKTPKKIGSPLYMVKRANRILSKPAELWVDRLRNQYID